MQINILVLFICVTLLIGTAYTSPLSSYDDCVINPTDPSCAKYVLPDSTILPFISALCGMMPTMPGCTINSICQDPQYSGSEYCKPFAVYKVLCNDMPKMNNCTAYKSMCSPINGTSSVQQCKMNAIQAPNSSYCFSLITDMCSEMFMDGCAECTKSCEYLQYYSDMCLSMPDMSDCADWKKMCSPIGDWPLCNSEAAGVPIMRMYFHTGIMDYVLFKKWVPRSDGFYVFTWFVVFLFGVSYEFLKLIRTRLEKRWNAEFEAQAEYQAINNGGKTELLLNSSFFAAQMPFRWDVDLLRAFLHLLEVAWGLLIMLVAMTFNVGLFFAVLAGAFVGMLFVGRFMHYVPKASCH